MFIRKNKKYIYDESLYQPLKTDGNGYEYKVEDTILDESSDFVTSFEIKENYKIIRQIVENLNEKDNKIMKMYFGFETEPFSQKEIAKAFELSQSYISRIIQNALMKIRFQLQKQGVIEISKIKGNKESNQEITSENILSIELIKKPKL